MKAIDELCSGSPTPETDDFLQKLTRPMLPSKDAPQEIYLVGITFEATLINL